MAPGEVAATPWHAGRIVGRPEQPGFSADVIERLLFVPHVIARCHDVNAPVQKLVADFAGNAKASGGIFDVCDDEIDGVMLDDRCEPAPYQVASRPSNDVTNEKDTYHERLAPRTDPTRTAAP